MGPLCQCVMRLRFLRVRFLSEYAFRHPQCYYRKKKAPPCQRFWRVGFGSAYVSNFSAHSFPRTGTKRYTRTPGISEFIRRGPHRFIMALSKVVVIVPNRPVGCKGKVAVHRWRFLLSRAAGDLGKPPRMTAFPIPPVGLADRHCAAGTSGTIVRPSSRV